MHLLKLYPSYGIIPSLDEARADFLAGKTFSLSKLGGPYCTIKDFIKPEGDGDRIRAYDAVILIAVKCDGSTQNCVVTLDEMREMMK